MLFIFIYLDVQPQNTQARTYVSLCEYANMFMLHSSRNIRIWTEMNILNLQKIWTSFE